MKRDWDLIRKQLTDIEEENDLFVNVPVKPVYKDQDWDSYEMQLNEFLTIKGKVFGHLELLINAGYVDGLTVDRSIDGVFSYGLHSPRLTMAGHDLFDTMRSDTVWEKIKATAKSKGIELTFDAIKVLAVTAYAAMLG